MLLACEQSSRTSRRPRAGTALKYQSAANASRSRRTTASDSGAAADEECVTHHQFRKSRERHLQAPSSCAYSAWTSHWSARAASAAIASLSMPRLCSPFRPAARASASTVGLSARLLRLACRHSSAELGDRRRARGDKRRRRRRGRRNDARASRADRARTSAPLGGPDRQARIEKAPDLVLKVTRFPHSLGGRVAIGCGTTHAARKRGRYRSLAPDFHRLNRTSLRLAAPTRSLRRQWRG
jgi:hypothetical protein